jgi:AraC family transcriptional regulator
LARPAEFTGGMPVWLAMGLYRELRASDQLSPLAIEGLALELVAQAGRDLAVLPGVRPPAWLERVKEFITVHFREQVTLAEMAREAGVHPVHLVTVFRRHMRCTPFDFLRRLRVDFAAGQLVHSETPLVEIALTAGFADQSHFCRLFKIMTGMTPTAYRELLTRGS